MDTNDKNNAPYIPPNFVPAPYPVQKKVYEPLTKIDGWYLAVVFLLCFVFVYCGFFGFFALGMTISFVMLFVTSTAYLIKKGTKPSAFSIVCGALGLACSFNFVLYSNGLMKFFDFILISLLYSIYAGGMSKTLKNEGNFKIVFDVLKNIFVRPFAHFPIIINSIMAGNKKSKKSTGIIIGIAAAVPVLCVVVPLLVSSDAAFGNMVHKLLDNMSEYIVYLVLTIIIFPFVYSGFYAYRNKATIKNEKYSTFNFNVSSYICISFLSVVSLIYVVYLFSQLAYFVSAFSNMLPDGYTDSASQYAREGFYQMCAVSAINLILLGLSFALVKREKGRIPKAIKALGIFMTAFSVFLIICAVRKMKLNIDTYGLTVNRLLVLVLMFMILLVFGFFVVHIFNPKLNYVQPIVVICSAVFVALSLCNIEAVVLDYNLKNSANTITVQNKTKNYEKLGLENLSSDVGVTVKSLYEKDLIEEKDFVNYVKYNYHISDEASDDNSLTLLKLNSSMFYNYSANHNRQQLYDYIKDNQLEGDPYSYFGSDYSVENEEKEESNIEETTVYSSENREYTTQPPSKNDNDEDGQSRYLYTDKDGMQHYYNEKLQEEYIIDPQLATAND